MQKMGLQSCCLLCDAQDIAGTARCKKCINAHSLARKVLDGLSSEDEVGQLGRELLQMISAPQRWDHDEVHGPALKQIQFLAGTLAEPKPQMSSEDVEALFAAQAAKPKTSLIRDIANRSKWKDEPPSAELARAFGENLPIIEDDMPGARTIPSRPIKKIDRSDRIGEDRELVDRVVAELNMEEKGGVKGREKARKVWSEVVDSVEDILEDEYEVKDDLDI